MAATVGVTAYKALGTHVGLAGAWAVATTIVILQLARSLHPPAGATALIAVLGPAQVHRLGYEFVLTPVLAGSLILLAVAVVMNNLSAHANRHYPTHWWWARWSRSTGRVGAVNDGHLTWVGTDRWAHPRRRAPISLFSGQTESPVQWCYRVI